MPLYAATRASEMLGVAVLFGPKTYLRPLKDDDWRAAGAVGFDVLRLGGAAVEACLRDLPRHHD